MSLSCEKSLYTLHSLALRLISCLFAAVAFVQLGCSPVVNNDTSVEQDDYAVANNRWDDHRDLKAQNSRKKKTIAVNLKRFDLWQNAQTREEFTFDILEIINQQLAHSNFLAVASGTEESRSFWGNLEIDYTESPGRTYLNGVVGTKSAVKLRLTNRDHAQTTWDSVENTFDHGSVIVSLSEVSTSELRAEAMEFVWQDLPPLHILPAAATRKIEAYWPTPPLDSTIGTLLTKDAYYALQLGRDGNRLICWDLVTKKVRWQVTPIGSSSGSIRLIQPLADQVIVNAESGLFAFDQLTGQKKWQQVTHDIRADFASTNGVAAAVISKGAYDWSSIDKGTTIGVIKTTSGRFKWSREWKERLNSSLFIDRSTVSLTTDSRFAMLDLRDGKSLYDWELPILQVPHEYAHHVANNQIYILCGDMLHAISLRSGKPIWQFELEAAVRFVPNITADDRSIFVRDEAGWLYAIDQKTGHGTWRQKIKETRRHGSTDWAPILVNQNMLLVATEPGHLWCLSPREGDILWYARLNSPLTTAPFIHANKLYLATQTAVYITPI